MDVKEHERLSNITLAHKLKQRNTLYNCCSTIHSHMYFSIKKIRVYLQVAPMSRLSYLGLMKCQFDILNRHEKSDFYLSSWSRAFQNEMKRGCSAANLQLLLVILKIV